MWFTVDASVWFTVRSVCGLLHRSVCGLLCRFVCNLLYRSVLVVYMSVWFAGLFVIYCTRFVCGSL